MSTNWIEQAESALRGEPAEGVELLSAHAPPWLDPLGRSVLLAPFLAAFMWAAVVFRARLAAPLDPILLLLRLLALAASARAGVLGFAFAARVRIGLQRARYAVALHEEGLLVRTPHADYALPKADVIDIRERGAWQERGGRQWREVYVVTRPASGRTHVALPPIFERSSGVLAERLMRWRGAVARDEERAARAEPAALASTLFDAAAAGEAPPGGVVIREGRSWLKRGPYATMLLGLALCDGFLRLPAAARARVGTTAGVAIALCLAVMPLAWLFATRRERAARKGIALLLTPAELLLRTRAGVHRTRWSDMTRSEVVTRRAWSIVMGAHEARTLVLGTREDGDIRYAEALMDTPAEVVAALTDAYRKGSLP